MGLVDKLNKEYRDKFGPLCNTCDTYQTYCRCVKDKFEHRLVVADIIDVGLVKINKLFNMKIKINSKDINFKIITSKGKVIHFAEESDKDIWTNLSFDEKVAIRSLIYDYKYE